MIHQSGPDECRLVSPVPRTGPQRRPSASSAARRDADDSSRVHLLGHVHLPPMTPDIQSTSRSAPPWSASTAAAVGQVRGEDAGRRARQEVLVDDRLGHAARRRRPGLQVAALAPRRTSAGPCASVRGHPVGEERQPAGRARARCAGSRSRHTSRCDVRRGRAVAGPTQASVDLGDQLVVERPAPRGQRDAARLDLAEPHAQRPLGDAAVGLAERPRLGERAERRLPQQHVRAVPAAAAPGSRRSSRSPRACIEAYRSSMSSTRGVRWLRCVVVTPPMSAATAGDALQLGVPGPVDRLAGQRERRGRPARGSARVVGSGRPPVLGGAVGQRQQLGREQRAGRRGTACSRRCERRASKKRRSSGTSIEVNTRNGLRASSSRSSGRNAVDTTGTGRAPRRAGRRSRTGACRAPPKIRADLCQLARVTRPGSRRAAPR